MEAEAAVAGWSDVSGAWVAHTKSDDATVVRSVLGPLMLQALEPQGKAVLDIGCGEGYFARVLKESGAARVAGLDISPGLINEAQTQDADGEYRVQDIQAGPFFGSDSFDAISAFMVLMYMADLDAAYRNISTILRPSGRLVACITNPYYTEPVGYRRWRIKDALDRYLDPGSTSSKLVTRQFERVVRSSRFDYVLHIKNYFDRRTAEKKLSGGDFQHFHRPFSDYLNLAMKHDLHLEAMWEPQISADLRAQYRNEPVAQALGVVPILFVLVFAKG
jgi:SAM-dependent methyltransferase